MKSKKEVFVMSRSSWIDYDELSKVPGKIEAQIAKNGNLSARQIALMIRDELLVTWLLILPWRSRNICQCKLGTQGAAGTYSRRRPVRP